MTFQPSKWTQQVYTEIQELQKTGIIKADGQGEYALLHADDDENECMSVRDCADLICVLSAV